MPAFDEVAEVVRAERQYQRNRWGANKEQSLAGYLLIMQAELNEAIDGWMKNESAPRDSCLEEVAKAAREHR